MLSVLAVSLAAAAGLELQAVSCHRHKQQHKKKTC